MPRATDANADIVRAIEAQTRALRDVGDSFRAMSKSLEGVRGTFEDFIKSNKEASDEKSISA